jgi:hypothetical protein
MIVLYVLILVKIIAMRYKFYHATQTFSKNDQVLVSFIINLMFVSFGRIEISTLSHPLSLRLILTDM